MTNCLFGCHRHRDKIGILLAQLGTPDEPTPAALRRYLKEFLSDRRVIEINRVLWWFILRLFVLTRRPAASAKLYQRIWTDKGSPLKLITERQVAGLEERLRSYAVPVEVRYGMRYGQPSLDQAIDELIEAGCGRILLFPLYPQYAAATTGSTYDAVFSKLLKSRWVPTLKVVEPYYVHHAYIDALAARITDTWENQAEAPERLIISYHGVPVEYVTKGDPYCCMCTETTAALRRVLPIPSELIVQTYQSRFGRAPWLQPYTDETLERLAESGVKRVVVTCPGFVTDCLETLDEIGNEGEALFKDKGGESLTLVPCLNDHRTWLDGVFEIVASEISPWVRTSERLALRRGALECPSSLGAASK